jgi:hypothetical protein
MKLKEFVLSYLQRDPPYGRADASSIATHANVNVSHASVPQKKLFITTGETEVNVTIFFPNFFRKVYFKSCILQINKYSMINLILDMCDDMCAVPPITVFMR